MIDIIIIGAGTAGLSAAIYGVRAGKSVLLLEESSYGGQIINSSEVENYPGIKHISGFEFATNLYNQAIELGANIKYEKVVKIEDSIVTNNGKVQSASVTISDGSDESAGKKTVTTTSAAYECNAVILATGARNRKLGVEREKELTGAGVSYCATCDGAFFRGKDVAVAGGGNTALEDASFLSEYCNKVYIIHRRDTFRGEDKLVSRLSQKDNIEFVLNSNINELLGESTLEGIRIINNITSEESTINVSGLFIAIGQMPENAQFTNVIDTDDAGYVKAGENCITRTKGVFTAGDCRTKTVRQLTTAAADGAVAALAACEYIQNSYND